MKFAAIALLSVALCACSRHPSAVEAGLGKLDDAGRFTTSARAAQTVADISTKLRLAGASCRPKHAPRCTVQLQAAAYSAVTAYTIAECTAPGVYDGRTALLRYLRAADRFLDDGAKGAVPSVPKVVTC